MSVWDQELFRLGETVVTPTSLVVLSITALVTIVVARLIRTAVVRMLRRGGPGTEGRAYAVSRILEYGVYITGFLLGLENLGVSLTALAAVGAVLSVGIGFGLQNIAQNFISGIILLVERPVQHGDVVDVGGTVGAVEEIGMRATRVVTLDRVSILVPNSKLVTEEVRNFHVPNSVNRLRVGVGVAYGSDVELVRRVLVEAGEAHPDVLDDPAPRVFFQSFGDSSLDFELMVFLDNALLRLVVASDLRFAIDAAFRRNGVTIPFPQRDLHLVSGFSTKEAS